MYRLAAAGFEFAFFTLVCRVMKTLQNVKISHEIQTWKLRRYLDHQPKLEAAASSRTTLVVGILEIIAECGRFDTQILRQIILKSSILDPQLISHKI